MSEPTDIVLNDIYNERVRQNDAPDDRAADDVTRFRTLGAAMGNVANAGINEDQNTLRGALVKLAAVAVAWIERIDEL